MERSLYIYRNVDGFEPIILSLRDDGDIRQRNTLCPSGREARRNVQLIGYLYESDQVCFKDLDRSELCVWDVKRERVIERVVFDMNPMEREGFWGDVIGFSRTRAGDLKFLRIWQPQPLWDTFCEVSCVYQEGQWMNKLERHTNNPFCPDNGTISLISGNLYCVGMVGRAVKVLRYNIETDHKELLPAPLDGVSPAQLALGPGGQSGRELTASIFLPRRTTASPDGQLRVFVLQEATWQWHLFRVYSQLPPIGSSMQSIFVPVFSYRKEGSLHCVFLAGSNTVVVISSMRASTIFTYPIDGAPSLQVCNVGCSAIMNM